MPAIIFGLGPKDLATLALSSLALALSLASFRQRRTERDIGIRKQLTDAIAKLNEFAGEFLKFNDPRTNDKYPANYDRYLLFQQRFYVSQAEYLAKEVPKLVTPYELALIADVSTNVNRTKEAEALFEQALKHKHTPWERAIILGAYGHCLFSQGRAEEARGRFHEAVHLVQGESDAFAMKRGETYQGLAVLERQMGDPSRVPDLIALARSEFEKVRFAPIRDRLLAGWEQARANLLSPPPAYPAAASRAGNPF